MDKIDELAEISRSELRGIWGRFPVVSSKPPFKVTSTVDTICPDLPEEKTWRIPLFTFGTCWECRFLAKDFWVVLLQNLTLGVWKARVSVWTAKSFVHLFIGLTTYTKWGIKESIYIEVHLRSKYHGKSQYPHNHTHTHTDTGWNVCQQLEWNGTNNYHS